MADVSDGHVRASTEQAPRTHTLPQTHTALYNNTTSVQSQVKWPQQNQQPVQFAQPDPCQQSGQSVQQVQTFTELLDAGSTAFPPQHQPQQTRLAPESNVLLPPGAASVPGIPPGLLYDQTQPDQVSEHTIYTLGPITLDQDEFAASIAVHQTGVEMPETQKVQLFIEPISFTETFFGSGGYPRLCQSARDPGVRHKQVCVSFPTCVWVPEAKHQCVSRCCAPYHCTRADMSFASPDVVHTYCSLSLCACAHLLFRIVVIHVGSLWSDVKVK